MEKISIHLIADKPIEEWNPIWVGCYEILSNLPYKIIIWDKDKLNNLLKEDDEYFYNTYLKNCADIIKYDYGRHVILEKFENSAYLDLDVELKHNIFELIQPNKFYCVGGYGSGGIETHLLIRSLGFSNAFFFLYKRFMQQRIMDTSKYSNEWFNTTWKAGPIAFTHFMLKWIQDTRYTKESLQNQNNIEILPYDVFSLNSSDFSYCIHHNTNEWKEN